MSASAYYRRASGQRSERAIEDGRLVGEISRLHEAKYVAYGPLNADTPAPQPDLAIIAAVAIHDPVRIVAALRIADLLGHQLPSTPSPTPTLNAKSPSFAALTSCPSAS